MGAFMKKWRLEVIKLEHSYARFDEDRKVVGKCDRTKGYELRIVNKGKLARSVHSESPRHPSVFRDKAAPFLRGGHLSHEGLRACFRVWRGVRESFLHLCFSDSSSLKYSVCQHNMFWDSVSQTPSATTNSVVGKRSLFWLEVCMCLCVWKRERKSKKHVLQISEIHILENDINVIWNFNQRLLNCI